jgi:hypothetical protein
MDGLGIRRAHPLMRGMSTDRKSNPQAHLHMKPFSNIAKRVLLASGLALLAACSSNGPTDPTSARKSGYLTVSATVSPSSRYTQSSGYNVPANVTTTQASGYNVPASVTTSGPGNGNNSTSSSGYNVPAN